MQLTWKHVGPLFQLFEYPVEGDRQSWESWYEEAWEHLLNAGLAKAEVPIDGTRIKLRIIALCWIAHDFCAVTLESGTDLYWTDLGRSFEIDPVLALLVVANQQSVQETLAEADVFTMDWLSNGDEEESLEVIPEEFTDDLAGRITAYAAFRHRDEVVNALLKGFGDMSSVFASMYANFVSDEQIISEREEELEEIRDSIIAEIETAPSSDDLERLQIQLRLNSQQREKRALIEYAFTEKRNRALMDEVYLCDDPSEQRMKGFQWFDDGCPVELHGYPES